MRTPLPFLPALIIAAAMLGPLTPAFAGDNTQLLKVCIAAERKAEHDGRACMGRISDPCLEQPDHGSTTSIVACVDDETNVWDTLLNADYKSLLALLDDKAQDSVRKAQRAWIAARDADCHVPYDIYQGGTLANIDMANCMLNRTATRVLQLGAWRDMARPEEANDLMQQDDSAQPQDQPKPDTSGH
jgi:uncharacterized protein YecT (DUF1311 family)